VKWMMKQDLAKNKEEAVTIGKKILQAGIISHVLDQHDFEDSFLFYCFKKDVDKLTMISEKERLKKELKELEEENNFLKKEVIKLRSDKEAWEQLRDVVASLKFSEKSLAPPSSTKSGTSLSFIIVGATSTYAWKEIYPALFSLFTRGLLPDQTVIATYAEKPEWKKDKEFCLCLTENRYFTQAAGSKLLPNTSLNDLAEQVEAFVKKYVHCSGDYSAKAWKLFAQQLGIKENFKANRIFFLAVPPKMILPVSKVIRSHGISESGWTRIIMQTQGTSLDSSTHINESLGELFTEEQIFRHNEFLGLEMVKNILALRFTNLVLSELWNREHIELIQITSKRKGGLGSEFAKEGIIRNMLQNNLFQVMTLMLMDMPISLNAEDIRDETVKIAKRVLPIRLDDVVLGQYGDSKSEKEERPGFTEQTGLDGHDTCSIATFATVVLKVKHPKWKGVPIILKSGYALNEDKTEIRIQFRRPPMLHLFGGTSPNELVMLFEPKLAVYLKMHTKKPGLEEGLSNVELDMTYKKRLQEDEVHVLEPSAGVIYNTILGNHTHTVRADMVYAAWKVWEPIMKQIEAFAVQPIIYPHGSRGPEESDDLIKNHGFQRSDDYTWNK